MQVKLLLDQGWTLSGTMQCAGNDANAGLFTGSSKVTYSQSLVLHEGYLKQIAQSEHDKVKDAISAYNSGCLVLLLIFGAGLYWIFF